MVDGGGMGHGAQTRLDAARERLLAQVEPHGRREIVPVQRADGRAAAEALEAKRSVPHYERAAMDGFALRASDVDGPTALTVADAVRPGTAMPVHTGSPVPAGADAVVRVERTRETPDGIEVESAVAVGDNVAPIGEDVVAAESLVDGGERLSPPALALLAAAGHERIPVLERPRVSVVPTGGELVPSTVEPGRGETPETNGIAVARLLERWGGSASRRDPVPDRPGALADAIRGERDQDLIVTLAGTSVGDRDRVPAVLEDLGTLSVHGVSVKPGHPAGFGRVGETSVLMLPGYPVSVIVIATLLLQPAVAASGGYELPSVPTTAATLDAPIDSDAGVRRFATVSLADGRAVPIQSAGAGVLSSVTRADGWVVVPEDREALSAGERVTVEHWLPRPGRERHRPNADGDTG